VSHHRGKDNSEHLDVMVGKAFAMLGFIGRLSFKFRDPYTLKFLYTSLVRPRLEYAICVWNLLYDVRVDKIDLVQRRLIRYALRGLGWMDTYELPPYEHRCALLRLDTLAKRRSIAFILFVFDILGDRMNSPKLLSALDTNTPRYRNRGSKLLRFSFHCTNYGAHDDLFDFILTRYQFMNRLKLTL
jgi:hypothetical protein